MRYFTPQRYLRLGRLDDEQEFRAAQDEWEAAIATYTAHLARVGPGLPSALRELIGTVYLHDAAVLDMWQQDDGLFTITLHPESDPSRLVVLSYDLVEPARVNRAALPEEVHSEPTAWLYDEIDVEPGAGGDSQTTFRHDALLSNGWELGLRFRAVSVTRPVPLLPLALSPRSA